MDRRTVAKRLRDVPASGRQGGHDVWRLADAAPVLSAPPVDDSQMPGDLAAKLPPGFEGLSGVRDPVHMAAAFTMMQFTYRTPAQAAIFAVQVDAPCRVAFALFEVMRLVLMTQCGEMAAQSDIEPWTSNNDPSIWCLAEFDAVDWKVLADEAGEAVDMDAWSKYTDEVCANMSDAADAESAP